MLEIVFNNLSKPDGSALVEQNSTIVQAAVFGPVEVPQSKVNYEEAFIEINFKPKVSIPSSNPEFEFVRESEFILKSIFKNVILTRMHPRTLISIIVQEIYDAGSLLTVSINAICAALLDAGLPLNTPIAAVTIVLKPFTADDKDINKQFVLQPNKEAEKDGKYASKLLIVYDNQSNVTTLRSRGKLVKDALRKACELGREESNSIFEAYRAKVRDRFIIAT